jgi:hypothetical protein
MNAPALTAVGRLSVTVGAPVMVGPVGALVRGVVPITGGTLEGALSGRILPGGFDWAWLAADGSARIEARYLIELADGTPVTVVNTGLCRPEAGSQTRFVGESAPVFEVAPGPHDWLMRHLFLCRFTSDLAGGRVELDLFRVA